MAVTTALAQMPCIHPFSLWERAEVRAPRRLLKMNTISPARAKPLRAQGRAAPGAGGNIGAVAGVGGGDCAGDGRVGRNAEVGPWKSSPLGEILKFRTGGHPRSVQNCLTDDPNGVN